MKKDLARRLVIGAVLAIPTAAGGAIGFYRESDDSVQARIEHEHAAIRDQLSEVIGELLYPKNLDPKSGIAPVNLSDIKEVTVCLQSATVQSDTAIQNGVVKDGRYFPLNRSVGVSDIVTCLQKQGGALAEPVKVVDKNSIGYKLFGSTPGGRAEDGALTMFLASALVIGLLSSTMKTNRKEAGLPVPKGINLPFFS